MTRKPRFRPYEVVLFVLCAGTAALFVVLDNALCAALWGFYTGLWLAAVLNTYYAADRPLPGPPEACDICAAPMHRGHRGLACDACGWTRPDPARGPAGDADG